MSFAVFLYNESVIISNLIFFIKFKLNTKSVILKYFKAWHPYVVQKTDFMHYCVVLQKCPLLVWQCLKMYSSFEHLKLDHIIRLAFEND